MKYIFVFFLFSVFSSCGGGSLADPYVLDRLRVLALIADQPEASAGDTVTITPVVSDPNGEGRALFFSIEACLDPGLSYGADPNCDTTPTAYKTTIAEQSLTGLSAPHYTGAATSTFSITLPQAALAFIGRSAADQYNGVVYLIVFSLRSSDGVTKEAIKRVIISTKGASEKNTNPVIGTGSDSPILSNGNSLSTRPSESIQIKANIKSSQEYYFVQDENGNTSQSQERFEVLWYINEGSVSPKAGFIDEESRYNPPAADSSALLSVLVIDGRGGASFGVLSF